MTPGSESAASKKCIDYSLVPIFLKCRMNPSDNDVEASTVREYLSKLLAELWRQKSEFSGKRPFGYSGWYLDIYHALQAADLMDDPDDHDARMAEREWADAIIQGCIWEMGYHDGR